MRKYLSITLLTLLVPQIALSAATLTIADTVAGLGTTATVRGMEGAKTVTVSVVPPYGPQTVLEATTDASGTASVRIEGSSLEAAGTYSVSLQTPGAPTASTETFAVLPDSLDPVQSTIETDEAMMHANGNETATVRVVARDRYGNPIAGRRIALISGRPEDVVTNVTAETDTRGEQVFAVATAMPGTIDLRAMDLVSGKLVASSVQIEAGSWGMGGNDWSTGSRLLASAYGYRAPTSGTYSASVTGRRFFGQVGSTFDIVHHFEIRLDRDVKEVNVFDPLSLDISAVDRSGNVVEDYVGAVQIYTTDPEALVPSEIRFTPADFGVKRLSLSLRFQTPGEPNAIGEPTHVIRVEEVGSCDVPGAPTCIFGEQELIVRPTEGGGEPGRSISVSFPQPDGMVGSTKITVEGKGPPFINIEITGGIRDAQGETDTDGRFAIPIELEGSQTDHTLRIRDASGRYDSGNIRIHLDTTPPEIGEISFDPPTPEVGSPASVRVTSEERIASATLVIGETETKLTQSKTASGTLTGIFTPTVAGPTMAVVRLSDAAGNTGETRVQLSVIPQALPTVTGVRATAKIEQVELTWNPLEDPSIEGYRIYVGMEPKNYSSYLDSPDPRGGATVGGLKPGTTYYFAVTAIGDDRESKNKSIEVTSVPLGLKLDITPQDGALLIEWSALDEDTPLSSFILEYGVEPGAYTEKRVINGDLRAYTLRDLLNDITYYLRLTPITTTGDALKDLAAEGQGSPAATGRGFHPSAADPVPLGLIGNGVSGSGPLGSGPQIPSSGTVHSGAPETPLVGLPPIAWWIAGALTSIACYVHYQRRKTLRMTLEFLRSMETRYRSV